MNNPVEVSTMPAGKAESYINLMVDMLPLFGLAFSIIVLKGLAGIKSAYVGTSMLSRFLNIIWTATIGAIMAVGCAALAPVIYPSIGLDASVGITVLMSVGGLRLVDSMVYKHLGIHLVDSESQSKEDREWADMSEEDKADALKQWHENEEHKEGDDE